ncbi:MAG TPA: winged helix-turn-helix domain-containing protein [Thermoanaerobaculia bacterium]|jgi:DNA-binding winged helix-turn-helix (wHTH) protein
MIPSDATLARPLCGYRFGDVEVDVLRRSVSVGGEEVACRPLVFQLLVLLCEAGGAVVERAAIFSRLWPESVVASDESLTQIAHRLRGTLGPSGAALRTVRGVGFRLDAQIEPIYVEPVLAEPVLSQSPIAVSEPPRSRRAIGSILLALFGLAAVGGLWTVWRSRELLDSGFALRRSDLGSDRAETADLVRRALAAWGDGDRLRARTLLETADRTDPATPIPAALLSLSQPGGQDGPWTAEAERRLPAGASAYQRLLVRYAGLSRESENAESMATLSALLELRPDAWNLRLARAHYHLARRERAAALTDLRQIPVQPLGNRGLAIVLADRASLGDADGADRDLRSGRLEGEEALAAFVRGRIRRSQHRPKEARLEFQRSIEEATRRNQPDLATESRLLAGITAYESGDPAGASLWLDRYAAEPSNPHRDDACEALALSAYLADRRGDTVGRDRRLAEARRRLPALDISAIETRIAVTLLDLRLQGKSEDLGPLLGRITSQPELLGVRSLLLARRAFQKPEDRAEAARLLRQSRLEGVDQTYFAEEAALLGSDLGAPPAHLWVDPPYPNLLRFAAVWELDRRRAARSAPR